MRAVLPFAVALGFTPLGCQAERIEVVGCASSADCSAPQICREQECVDDGALRIDDFEDTDPYPLADSFSVWRAYTYNAGSQYVDFAVEAPGYRSDSAIHLDFEIHDPPNGSQDYGLAGLDTTVRNLTTDLSAFSAVSFSYAFESAQTDCAGAQHMNFGFYCAGYVANFETTVLLAPSWQTAQLPLSDFHEVTWRPPTGVPVTDCLATDTALYFEIVPELGDGECGAGRVSIDTLYLQ